ncbi:hypothetical protein AOQ84DRAFT_94790 [Glonium stellatum]|uniref:Zn(2)-C6 fungal-type domain-containing protein n=1 Tax=Glonium stellatum TaxID=574774 RepID=A0A8E2EVY0_9PEZI|nr:hypothetical protein AOQ84DRAFT_94790 [Glonium stellatum]
MTTPDAEDASPSPDYSGDQDGNDMAEQKDQRASSDASPAQQSSNGQKPASNAKDPLRPRRKKARRACYACQRAHLTCGDERPCHRCIKRGLQDACMDGVRKKAKYLHDAPNEALMPGIGGNYHHLNGSQPPPLSGQISVPNTGTPLSQQSGFYQQPQPGNFNMYPQNSSQGQLPPSMQESAVMGSFSNQQTPISPPYSSNPNQQTPPMQNVPSSMPQASQANAPQMHHFGGPLFDPSDPALFNFDIASLNFGNHYGALEFGMLGHMSSGAAETPPSDNSMMNPLNQAANMFNPQIANSAAFENQGGMTAGLTFGPDGLPATEWQNTQSRQGSITQVQTPHNTPIATVEAPRNDGLNGPHAYAIGAGPSSLSSASPQSTGGDLVGGFDNGPMSPATFFVPPNQHHMQQHSPMYNRPQQPQAYQQPQYPQSQQAIQPQSRPNITLHPVQANAASRKRRRDTSTIYEGITKAYPYTSGFHRLFGLIRERFPKDKEIRIARALAAIRPSFIACTKDLTDQDLVFGEKNLQRQLLTYEDSIEKIGTPTIICRRTGEVAAVGKEFSILTGWRREVLLGKEPNANVNWGGSGGSQSVGTSGSTSRGAMTPLLAGQEQDTGPRPVSIAELMDEDSVVQFYEDFAKMAFGDSRGFALRSIKLLKYRTKEDMLKLEELTTNEDNGIKSEPQVKAEGSIGCEAGMYKLGQREGMVQCMCSWMIKRDNFDMPMLIVMSILPKI